MTKVLALKSSILGQHSSSSALVDELASHFQAQGASITKRDLAAQALPMLDAEVVGALRGGDQLSDSQQQILAQSDILVDELKQADVLVVAAPMYNFSIPTQLKNWLDLIARAGVTFSYTEQGPKGLIENTKAIVVTTRGGLHKDAVTDSMIPYLKTMLGFVGITEVEVVYAEALAMGEEAAAPQLAAAKQRLAELV